MTAYNMVHFVTDKGTWPPTEWHERNYTLGKPPGLGKPSVAHLAEFVRGREREQGGQVKVLYACIVHRHHGHILALYKAS
jgi:hypothetical protein